MRSQFSIATCVGAFVFAAVFACSASAQTVDAAGEVPTVTIINKAPVKQDAAASPELDVTPRASPAAAAPPPAPASSPALEATAPKPGGEAKPSQAVTIDGHGTGAQAPAADATAPAPPPPAPTLSIDIDLTRQLMTVAEHGVPLHTWQISSARYGYRTPTGTFQPTWMTKMWYSRQYDLAPMPHAIFFHKGVAIHGTYATRALGNPASHGCVRLGLGHAATLFKLVKHHGKERTQIVVHGAPNHSTAGRVARYEGEGSSPDVVRFRRGTPYRYLPPSYYGRATAAYAYGYPTRRTYTAPRRAPRLHGSYSYGYGF